MKTKYFVLVLALILALALPAAAAEVGTEDDGVPVPAPQVESGQWAMDSAEAEDNLSADRGWTAEVDSQGRFLTAEGLYGTWQREGWPETVGDAWSTDGTMDHLIIAVVDGDEAAIEAIKAQMADPACLTFTSCSCSHAQLEQIMEEIETEVKTNHIKGVISLGMGLRDDDFSVNGQPCVKVWANEEYEGIREWAAALSERYGSLVELKLGGAPSLETTGYDELGRPAIAPGGGMDMGSANTVGVDKASAAPWYLWALLAVGAAGLGALAFSRRSALRTADGRTVTAGGRATRAQAKAAVRESAVTPDRDNWQAIQEKLK